jgi:hypothetical protein
LVKLLLRVSLAAAVCFVGCRATYRVVTAPVHIFHHEEKPAPTSDVINPGMPVAPTPTLGPRVVERTTNEPTSSQTARPSTSPKSSPRPATAVHFPTAKPVPDKPGYVFSPSDPSKYVDVTGYPAGSKVKDPYSGKIFLVP